MGDLSRSFSRAEFACRCGCGFDAVLALLVDVLQEVRDHFGQPVTVTSGCRCKTHNAKVGGSPRSQHLYGMAADIKVSGVSAATVYDFLIHRHPGEFGIGRYPSWVHVDVRLGPAVRWGDV